MQPSKKIQSAQKILIQEGYIPSLKGESAGNFISACENNKVKVVRAYLDLGMSPDVMQEGSNSPALIKAIEQKAIEVAEVLLEYGANIEAKDGVGDTALFTALNWSSHTECIKFLVGKGASLKTTDLVGTTLLGKCIDKDWNDKFDLMMSLGADPDFAETPDDKPLATALWDKKPAFVEKLLKAGAPANGPLTKGDDSALMIAAMKGNATIAALLIKAGADLSATNKFGWTAQMICRDYSPKEEVSIFGNNTLPPEQEDITNWFNHAESGNVEGMQMLFSKGFPVNQPYLLGGNAATVAASGKQPKEVLEFLASNKADLNAEDIYGRNPVSLIYSNHKELLGFVLRLGANPNNSNSLYAALRRATEALDEASIKILLEHGADPNTNKQGWTGLHTAAFKGKLDIATLLLKHGTDPNKQDKQKQTALHLALGTPHIEVVKLLIEKGADVNLLDHNSQSMLYTVANKSRNSDPLFGEAATLLLEHGASLSPVYSYGNRSAYQESINASNYPVSDAIEKFILAKYNENSEPAVLKTADTEVLNILTHLREFDTVKKILETGVSARELRPKVLSPLHVACETGSLGFALLFLQHGAAVDHGASYNNTPLEKACEKEFPEIVALLLKAGADPNHMNDYFSGPLHSAVRNNQQLNIDLLAHHGVDFHQYPSGYSPVMSAASKGHIEILRYLIEEKGCAAYSRDNIGFTPLTCAIREKHTEVVKLLLSYGSPTDFPSIDNESPLIIAIKKGFTEIVRLLIDAGASLTYAPKGIQKPLYFLQSREDMMQEFEKEIKAAKSGKEGKIPVVQKPHYEPFDKKVSPFFDALYSCNEEKADQLLKEGADANERNYLEETPLMIALACGNVFITNLLLENGADVNAKNKFGEIVSSYSLVNETEKILRKTDAKFGMDSLNNMAARSLREDKFTNAVKSGDLLVMEDSLLSGQVSIHFLQHHINPWYMALKYGDVIMVKRLVNAGLPIELKDKHGNTPLLYAAAKDFPCTELLIKSGANVNHINTAGDSPLSEAAYYAQTKSVHFLIENGADTSFRLPSSGYGLIHLAVQNSNLEILETAIPLSDINAQANYGDTPLHIALRKFQQDKEVTHQIIITLLNAGADPYHPNAEGISMRGKAERTEEEEVLTFLDRINVPSLYLAGEAGNKKASLEFVTNVWENRYDEQAEKAASLVTKDTNNAEEDYLLGLFLFNGFGIKKDLAASLATHRKAAEKGNTSAMFELYAMLSQGLGGPKDSEEAVRWCFKSAEGGYPRAMSNLGAFYATGNGVEKDETLSLKWYNAAAEKGHGKAAATLGIMYALGEGAPQSVEKAKEYFSIAQKNYFYWQDLAEAHGLDPDDYLERT